MVYEREREMERNEQIKFKKTPVYMRNEMRLREWLVDFVGRSGLVWYGVLLHSHVLLACLHGLNATNEVVMCISFFFHLSLENLLWSIAEQY